MKRIQHGRSAIIGMLEYGGGFAESGPLSGCIEKNISAAIIKAGNAALFLQSGWLTVTIAKA